MNKIIALAILGLLGAGSYTLLNHRTVSPKSVFMDKLFNVGTISNDLNRPLWIVEDTSHDVVSVHFLFKGSGDLSSACESPGLSDLLAAMLTEGSGAWDSQSFKRFLLEKNIQLSVTSDADHFAVRARTVRSSLSDLFRVLKAIVTTPRFQPNDLNRVKKQTVSQLAQNLHNPSIFSKEKYQETIFGAEHPYTSQTHHRLERIPGYTEEHLQKLLKESLVSSRLCLVAVGRITAPELKSFTDDLMASLPQGAPVNSPKKDLQNLGKTIRFSLDVPQTIIRFVQPSLSVQSPEFQAFSMIPQAMGGDFESRLMTEIRDKRGLAYYCQAWAFSFMAYDGLGGVTATQTKNVEDVIQLIKTEWDKLAQEGLGEDEFAFHKSSLIGSYPLGFGSTRSIGDALLTYATYDFSPEYVNERNARLRSLTRDQVNTLIQKYVRSDQLVFVVVGRDNDIEQRRIA